MRKFWGVPLLLLSAGALALAPSATAAQGPYTIAVGGQFVYPMSTAFVLSGCSTNLVDSPLNGSESRVVDVTGYANRVMTVRWSATAAAPDASSLATQYYDGGCRRIPLFGKTATAQGDITELVPSTAKWIVVTATGAANVTFTLLP